MAKKSKYPEVVLGGVVRAFEQVRRETQQYGGTRSYVLMQLVAARAAGWTDLDYETLDVLTGFATSLSFR